MIPIYPVGNKVQAAFQQGPLNLTALPPLSLYIHIPWCVRKCPYCDFNSHEIQHGASTPSGQTNAPTGTIEAASTTGFPEADYLAALRQDLEQALPLIWGRKVYTIFLGGGTPSLLSSRGMDQLLSDVRSLLPIDGAAEITMEANPGTFEAQKFADFRASGINRLSIGIQSFHGEHLAALGRIHDGEQARRAIDIAKRHFDNLNLDLMYALPHQTVQQASLDVATAIDFAPTHLSLYHLTMEPNTVFAKYPPPLPDDDVSSEMQDVIWQQAQDAGYAQYEVSAYARPGRQARHNLNYWQFGDYLGIGAGAHSKLSFPHRIIRQMRYKQPASYIEQTRRGRSVFEEVELGRADLGFEFMLNALRLVDGFAPALLAERTGQSIVQIEQGLQQAENRGLIVRDHQRIVPTALGQRFLNDLQQIFLPD